LFFTCRFIPTFNLTKPLVNKKWFKTIYKYHTYIWWLLGPSVLIHAVIALLHKLSGG
jgi:cytochrome b561